MNTAIRSARGTVSTGGREPIMGTPANLTEAERRPDPVLQLLDTANGHLGGPVHELCRIDLAKAARLLADDDSDNQVAELIDHLRRHPTLPELTADADHGPCLEASARLEAWHTARSDRLRDAASERDLGYRDGVNSEQGAAWDRPLTATGEQVPSPALPSDHGPLTVQLVADETGRPSVVTQNGRRVGRHPFREDRVADFIYQLPPKYRDLAWEQIPDVLTQADKLRQPPDTPEALTVERAEQLLQGGLDTETEHGIILPARGDDGLVYARDRLGKSRFLRWLASLLLGNGGTVLVLEGGDDLTGWASYALHHRDHLTAGRLTILPTGHLPEETDHQPDLLIVDPASRFIDHQDGGENLKSNVAIYWKTISRLWPDAVRLTAHHEGKADGEPSGSAEWLNTPAVVWHLHHHLRPDGERDKRLTHRKRRHGEPPEAIRYQTTAWGIDPIGTPGGDRDQLLVEAVTDANRVRRPATFTTIKGLLTPAPTRAELDGLVARGLLQRAPIARSKHGGYQTPDPVATDPLTAHGPAY